MAVSQNIERQATQKKAAERALELELLRYLSMDDLKRITLFDIEIFPGNAQYINRIYGRIRNDLSRPVHSVQLKASTYNAGGQLVEVKGFVYNPALYQGVPLSFDAEIGFYNLPAGYRCWVNVVAAQYLW
jgi:hypothetical protein